MSRPMNPPDPADFAAGRRPRPGPSIRPAGFTCLLLAPGLLAAGLYRGELAATLCGFSLLLFLLASFIGVACSALWWNGRLVSSLRKGGDIVSVRVSIPEASRLSILCVAMADYLVPYSTSPGRKGSRAFTLIIPLEAAETEGRIERPERGYYLPERPRILVRDYAGLFSWSVNQREAPSAETFPVYPEPDSGSRFRLPPGKTGRISGKSTFYRSEELHETRQYHPGDDPRRINWKVYAHTGALSVREGELLPPPSAEYVFIFNTRDPAEGNARAGTNRGLLFDILVNRAASLALDLLGTNHIVTILTKGQGTPARKTTIGPEHPKAEETLLTELSFPQNGSGTDSTRNLLDEIPPEAVVLFFTLPDVTAQSIRETGLTARGDRLCVYAGPTLPAAPRGRALPLLRSFFLRAGPARTAPQAGPVFNALAEELCLSLGREGIHAQTV